MTESLSAEEIAKCTESLDAIERFAPGYEETGDALIHLQTSEVRRLLAMASRLVELGSKRLQAAADEAKKKASKRHG
jgi:chaperonin cofactor prefoldin